MLYVFAVLFFLTVLTYYDFYDMQLKWVVMILTAVVLAAAVLRFAALREWITLPLCALTLYVLVVFPRFTPPRPAQENWRCMPFWSFRLPSVWRCCLPLWPPARDRPGRWMTTVLSGFAGAAGLVSIDLLSIRILSALVMAYLRLITTAYEDFSGLEAGVLMTSVFGNPNVFAGGAGMVVLAFLAFLLLERKERHMGTLVLMLETLVLTIISATLVSMTSLTTWTGICPISLLCVVVGAAALCALRSWWTRASWA